MAERTVLCIDPDSATVAELRRVLSPHGLHVESIPDGEYAIDWARAHGPSLIVLSVEPRKVGYAICNKLKRSPTLREVPLILVSAEETMATFEQHKKLRSRAEDYLLKPIDEVELLAKVERLVDLGAPGDLPDDDADVEEIELADDELSEVSLDDEEGLVEDSFGADPHTLANGAAPHPGVLEGHEMGGEAEVEVVEADGSAPVTDASLARLGDLSNPAGLDANVPSPFSDVASGATADGQVQFDVAQFDKETQDAFAALEAGSLEAGTPGPEPAERQRTGRGNGVPTGPATPPPGVEVLRPPAEGEVLDLKSMWNDADLPARLPWETPPVSALAAAGGEDQDSGGPIMAGSNRSSRFANTPPGESSEGAEDQLLVGLGSEVPPLPEEVLYDERHGAESAAKDQRIGELERQLDDLRTHIEQGANEKRAAEGRANELQGRIASLEAERQTLRKEMDEQRESLTHAANQGAFSKERDLLNLREIINRKEKDILDLRDGLDAKERLILDHKDKIREQERARRDLDERTLGFEKALMAANEKVAELTQDKDKSVEREKGLKARLDDAHEELRKGQDEIEATRKRATQELERVRADAEKVRLDLEAKLVDLEETHRVAMEKAANEWGAADAAQKAAYQAELLRLEGGHRLEVEGLQKRLAEEATAAAERLQTELFKLRREHEKTIAGLKEEQALQLASERQAYETQTEAKHRAYRDEVMGLRRRHEEELAAAEDRRQRDILEQEQRRVAELEQAENRRRIELQARDEDHHARVTESERRHLIEKTDLAERHRTEHDQALGRAARAEGQLVARAQELEQAYRRLAGFEADLDAARVEIGDREVKLAQTRDRLSELEAKVSDYEDQIVRAFQRLRADEKTTEKIRRALGVALALLDERAIPAQGGGGIKPASPSDEAEKS
jgi:CheY-like chemotaxis protein/peptidoglycan hydrolase CwlO-like protein